MFPGVATSGRAEHAFLAFGEEKREGALEQSAPDAEPRKTEKSIGGVRAVNARDALQISSFFMSIFLSFTTKLSKSSILIKKYTTRPSVRPRSLSFCLGLATHR